MKYQRSSTPTNQTLSLQGVGHVIGEPATNIKIGNMLMWNFHAKESVLDIVSETKAFMKIKVQSGDYIGIRTIKKSRLVCILKD